MIKITKNLFILLAFFGLFIGSAYADQKKVGFIYISPPGDHGWTYMHDIGRQYMESQLGDAVTSTYIENVPENADAVRAIRKLENRINPYVLSDFTNEFKIDSKKEIDYSEFDISWSL